MNKTSANVTIPEAVTALFHFVIVSFTLSVEYVKIEKYITK
ncbi:hypothetical protein [Mycoplasma sp. CSL7491-lung]|nr:hypothetical protein [Mycoplasma sp. CSL7491-lung]